MSSIAMLVGLESNKEIEETKERSNEEAHVGVNPSETTDCIVIVVCGRGG